MIDSAFLIKDFAEAMEFYGFARMMKDDLPDGQWEDLKEIAQGYRESYGKDTNQWSEDTKQSFTLEVQENYLYWL